MTGRRLLATGATGFMGGSFLAHLLTSSHPLIKELSFSTLVRKQEQADVLAAQGVNAILFQDLDDSELLKRVASEHDIIIHSANGFHTASTVALIEGLAERKKTTGRDVFFIQTSGTSNLADFPVSKLYTHTPPNRIFHDATDDIYAYEVARETITPYPQRTSEIAAIATGKALSVKAYVVQSPVVYGAGLGRFKTRSAHGPILVRAALAQGQAVYIGDGEGEWGHVHVEDLAVLYELLVGKMLAGEEIAEGEKGVYFAETGIQSWKAWAEEIGRAGYELGALKSPQAVSVTPEEFAQYLGGLGGNENVARLAEGGFASRAVTDAQKARSLGWTPRKTDEDWWASIKEEFSVIWGQTKTQEQ